MNAFIVRDSRVILSGQAVIPDDIPVFRKASIGVGPGLAVAAVTRGTRSSCRDRLEALPGACVGRATAILPRADSPHLLPLIHPPRRQGLTVLIKQDFPRPDAGHGLRGTARHSALTWVGDRLSCERFT